jgi:ribosomal protein L21E
MHDRISHLHLDYNGLHGIVSTVAGENYYVNMRNGNLRQLKRMKVFL